MPSHIQRIEIVQMMEDYSRPPIIVEGSSSNQRRLQNSFDFDNLDEYAMDKAAAKLIFREFCRNYRHGQIFIYRDALVSDFFWLMYEFSVQL